MFRPQPRRAVSRYDHRDLAREDRVEKKVPGSERSQERGVSYPGQPWDRVVVVEPRKFRADPTRGRTGRVAPALTRQAIEHAPAQDVLVAVREVLGIQVRVAPCHPSILPGHLPIGRFAPLFPDGVSNCFFAGFADFFFLLGETGKNSAITHLNIVAQGFDLGLALLGEVVDRH